MIKVTVYGNATKDAEGRVAKDGSTFATFDVASNRMRKKDGSEITDYVHCVCFGGTGEIAAKNVSRGDAVLCFGELQTGSYVNNSGVKVNTTDIVVNEIHVIRKAQNNGNASSNSFNRVQSDTPVGNGNAYNPARDDTVNQNQVGTSVNPARDRDNVYRNQVDTPVGSESSDFMPIPDEDESTGLNNSYYGNNGNGIPFP